MNTAKLQREVSGVDAHVLAYTASQDPFLLCVRCFIYFPVCWRLKEVAESHPRAQCARPLLVPCPPQGVPGVSPGWVPPRLPKAPRLIQQLRLSPAGTCFPFPSLFLRQYFYILFPVPASFYICSTSFWNKPSRAVFIQHRAWQSLPWTTSRWYCNARVWSELVIPTAATVTFSNLS